MIVRSVFVIKRADGNYRTASGWSGISDARVFNRKRDASLSIAADRRGEKNSNWQRQRYSPNAPTPEPMDHGEVVELHCVWPGEVE